MKRKVHRFNTQLASLIRPGNQRVMHTLFVRKREQVLIRVKAGLIGRNRY